MVYEIKTFIFNHDKNFFVNPETSIYAEDSYNSNEYEDSILDANKMFENIQVIKNTNEVEKDFKEAEEKLEKRIEEKKEALEQKAEEKSEKKAKKVTKKEDANSISEETKSLIEKFSKVANKTPDEIQIIDNNTVRYLNTINGKSV
jgi:FKBP-type peptidyl-prolyl cis-trans isomerase